MPNIEDLYTGKAIYENLSSEIIKKLKVDGYLDDLSILKEDHINNQFYIFKNGKISALAFYNAYKKRIEEVKEKEMYGIKPRSSGQSFVQHAILNEAIKLITIQGPLMRWLMICVIRTLYMNPKVQHGSRQLLWG